MVKLLFDFAGITFSKDTNDSKEVSEFIDNPNEWLRDQVPANPNQPVTRAAIKFKDSIKKGK